MLRGPRAWDAVAVLTTTPTGFVTHPSPMTHKYMLSSDVDSIAEARHHVRETLGSLTDADTLSRTELVVSELVTNSVRHAPGHPITLHLSADDDGGVEGRVEDHGRGVVAMRDRDANRVGGLGLVVVDQVTSAWGVHADTTHVWFRLDP
ncbi:MAG: serine/threonine-protein kinase RsbW [Thermoleophilaceae bacterium]|jgi:anti-sigma regulatory factor (Ser/Thr protein kinase)|nr:serine/threonine-protein kinase RsbW [Thermoleophilaceae bacterium]